MIWLAKRDVTQISVSQQGMCWEARNHRNQQLRCRKLVGLQKGLVGEEGCLIGDTERIMDDVGRNHSV